ncbi:MAG: DNA repair protein RadC [Erysipelotrichaceae bacterium]|nr:DNA repair protein RadC [Erysipelotrichaceae bacterium]
MSNEMMPREKALDYGISSLSNIELIALVVKTGNREKNVLELAEEILDSANGFSNLMTLSYEELISIKGIKKAKALELMAILEIAKRLTKLETISEPQLNEPKKVVEWLRASLGYSPQEEFFVVYLNGKGGIIKSEIMYKGNKNSASVGVDEILRKAILHKASGLLVAHNHPSDNITPSDADIQLTKKLSASGRMMGIPLLDHIIIGKTGYFSFKNHNMLE